MTLERKLTTILAADVVGYSRMIREDEEATIATLSVYRAIFDELIKQYHGRIFNTAGDSVLSEFSSPVEAVRCGLAVQEALATRNAEFKESRQMWFRMGINLGDILINGEDLLGDGVNIAARLESIAEPGGLCISNSVREQIESKFSFMFTDMGEQRVKNIPQPVRAFRLTPSGSAPPNGPNNPKTRRQLVLAVGGGATLILLGLVAWWSMDSRPVTGIARFDGIWQGEYHCDSTKKLNVMTKYRVAKISQGDFTVDDGYPGMLGHYSIRGTLDNQGNILAKGAGVGPLGNYTVEFSGSIDGETLTAKAEHNNIRQCTTTLKRKPL